jgi:AraC-like DNA-binding protein
MTIFLRANKETRMTVEEKFIMMLNASGVAIERNKHHLPISDKGMTYPFIVAILCTNGKARGLYDMLEKEVKKNTITILMPGHLLQPLEYSDDFTYSRIAISTKMMDELRSFLFSHDYEEFHHNPVFQLNDIQADRLLTITDQLATISAHSEFDLRHRNHVLLSLMSVGYEHISYYHHLAEQQMELSTHSSVFSRFCDLVVAHYRESKELQYYAEKLNYHPKYLSRIIISATNGIGAKEWIEQYVVAQSKRLMTQYPNKSIKQIAFLLGFNESSSFFRYFKRVTGITARTYRSRALKEG